jgi:hypothetical protein
MFDIFSKRNVKIICNKLAKEDKELAYMIPEYQVLLAV